MWPPPTSGRPPFFCAKAGMAKATKSAARRTSGFFMAPSGSSLPLVLGGGGRKIVPYRIDGRLGWAARKADRKLEFAAAGQHVHRFAGLEVQLRFTDDEKAVRAH